MSEIVPIPGIAPSGAAASGSLRGAVNASPWLAWQEQYNPSEIRFADYKRARRVSPIVRYSYATAVLGVTRRLGDYHHPDPAVEEAVARDVMPALRKGAGKVFGTARYFGACLFEPVWEAPEGRLRLRRIYVPDPEVWEDGEPLRDGDGELTAWKLSNRQQIDFFTDLRLRQTGHWAFGSDHDSAWGEGGARQLYGHYTALASCYAWEGIGAEVAALARVVMRCHGENEAALQRYADEIASLGANAAVALDAAKVEEVISLQGEFRGGSPFNDPISHHISGILWAMDNNKLLLMEAEHGTRAQSQTGAEQQQDADGEVARLLSEEVLLDQVIAPYLLMQFGPGVGTGGIEVTEASEQDMERLSRALLNFTTGGVLNLDAPQHRDWAREQARIPLLDEEPDILAALGEGRP